MAEPIKLFTDDVRADLAKSGLTVEDLNIRAMGPSEKHATGAPQAAHGYTIPYYSIHGRPLPFYRVRLLGNYQPKYRQLADNGNHIYFPKGFWELAEEAKYIIFTEGEKKAACAVKHGFACVAAGGVDSWSNRMVELPKDAKLTKGAGGKLMAKLPSGSEVESEAGELAAGMEELIALIIRRDIPLIIVYDSDIKGRVNFPVQASAARLGYALRFRGIPTRNIRQFVIVPPKTYQWEMEVDEDGNEQFPKLGLDDLLVKTGIRAEQLDAAFLHTCDKPSAFPVHPNAKEFVNKKLRRSKMTREQLQSLATAIICDMDAQGSRLHSTDEDELYYFSREDHKLIRASFKLSDNFHKSTFGIYLYQKYNLSISDERLLTWMGTIYAGEQPLTQVSPERVLCIRGDTLYYQINSGQMLRVNAKEIRVLDNGQDNVLFQSDAVQPLDKAKLVEHINGMLHTEGPMRNIWSEVISQTRIEDTEEKHQTRLLSYLYSISPWFYRWQGTQLPIEMVCGEPGSGKSTLYVLRLNILTGSPKLRNPPKDITDWGVSLAGVGGLHVVDNVNLVNSSLRQELSDEMCRLITEPNPSIEKRKLYSDLDTVNIPVKTVFAVTSVKQPFQNADIIQRAIITWMNKGTEAVEYEGDWATDRLNDYGGREGWVAHQIVFVHKLLKLISEKWDPKYRAKYRLKNVEQLLGLAAEVYGESPMKEGWISEYIESSQSDRIAENDTVLGALRKFSEAVIDRYGENNHNNRFAVKDIAEWMGDQDEYKGIQMLVNSRMLGKYMKQNPNLLATVAGITESGSRANATTYVAHVPKR